MRDAPTVAGLSALATSICLLWRNTLKCQPLRYPLVLLQLIPLEIAIFFKCLGISQLFEKCQIPALRQRHV